MLNGRSEALWSAHCALCTIVHRSSSLICTEHAEWMSWSFWVELMKWSPKQLNLTSTWSVTWRTYVEHVPFTVVTTTLYDTGTSVAAWQSQNVTNDHYHNYCIHSVRHTCSNNPEQCTACFLQVSAQYTRLLLLHRVDLYRNFSSYHLPVFFPCGPAI